MAAAAEGADPVARVARIVAQRQGPGFVAELEAADADFARADFEPALATYLRANPDLVDGWAAWSADQRWTPSAYLEGAEVGWYDAGRHHVRRHLDRAAAAADFIHRMAAWLARRVVIGDTATGAQAAD